MSILLGHGDGTFTITSELSNASFAVSIAAADFNGDGLMDLAVIHGTGVAMRTGKGDGIFNSPSTVPIPGDLDFTQVVVEDFNGDGKLDLAVSTGVNVVPTVGHVLVLVGNGDATFSASVSSVTPEVPLHLVVGDFNLDGIADVAALDITGDITVVLGRGDGTFGLQPVAAFSGATAQNFGIGGMDGDGRPDFIVPAAGSGNTIQLYFLLTEPTETASTAPVAVSLSGPGQHHVVASYPGDATAAAQDSNPVLLWGEVPSTSTALAITDNGSVVSIVSGGTAITLTASVSSAGKAVTVGQVNFCDASASYCTDIHFLGSAQLKSNGTAVFKLSAVPGNHLYKAVLVENGYGAPGHSATVALTVTNSATNKKQTSTIIAESGSVGDYTLNATVSETAAPMR